MVEGRLTFLHLLLHGSHCTGQPSNFPVFLGGKLGTIVAGRDPPHGGHQAAYGSSAASRPEPGAGEDECDPQDHQQWDEEKEQGIAWHGHRRWTWVPAGL